MPAYITSDGGIYLLENVFSNKELTLKLLVSNNPLVIASGGGYTDKTVTSTPSISVVDGFPTATWEQVIFKFIGPLDNQRPIIGMLGIVDNIVIFYDIFEQQIQLTSGGGTLKITPKYRIGYTLTSQVPANSYNYLVTEDGTIFIA
jgi:hypothetical protein